MCPILGPVVPLFWISCDKAKTGSALFAYFAEETVLYIPQDPPLVLHQLTS